MNQKIGTKLGIVIILLMAVTAGVFAWKKESIDTTKEQSILISKKSESQEQKSSSHEQQEDKNLLKEIEGSKNISTTNWKLYKNNKYSYTIKYPPNWNLKTKLGSEEGPFFYMKQLVTSEQTSVHDIEFGNILSDNLENFKNINGDYFLNISAYPNIGVHTNLKEWRKYDGNIYDELLINGNLALKFNEGPHKSYDGKNKDMAGSIRYYFINKHNDGYEITIWYKDASNELGEKIISTFTQSN